MRYHALACDYDGTLAWNGKVDESTIEALREVRRSGRKLLLVTSRELEDLFRVFPHPELFDRIVAENGALLYRPATREEKLLAEPPPEEFGRELKKRGAERVSVGRVIVATWEPHETTALEVIRDLGLELQVIFNKGAVMVLPSGVNKATGLRAALLELGLSLHNVAGVGDAENDHAFLSACECSVAVANALDTIKSRVDWTTTHHHGKGVVELIEALVASDLVHLQDRLHTRLTLGCRADGAEVSIPPYGTNVLIAGSSGGGKSTLALNFLERLLEREYQFVIIDPEGDYSMVHEAVIIGDNQSAPSVPEILDLLSKPDQNVVVNLVGIPFSERAAFFQALLHQIQALRARTGRPHWIVIDESHHVLPASRHAAELTVAQRIYGMMLITLEPNRVSETMLASIDAVIAAGEHPDKTLQIFAEAVGQLPRRVPPAELDKGQALAWFIRRTGDPFWFRTALPRAEQRRHRRKYAEGELPPDLSFYFRGPGGKLNLRAQNLTVFLQMAEGVDDETWLYHLKNGDISKWFREVIKDDDLANQTAKLEAGKDDAKESRHQVRSEIEQRYILAA